MIPIVFSRLEVLTKSWKLNGEVVIMECFFWTNVCAYVTKRSMYVTLASHQVKLTEILYRTD